MSIRRIRKARTIIAARSFNIPFTPPRLRLPVRQISASTNTRIKGPISSHYGANGGTLKYPSSQEATGRRAHNERSRSLVKRCRTWITAENICWSCMESLGFRYAGHFYSVTNSIFCSRS